MPVYTSVKQEELFNSFSVLTVGNFDGMHLGHQSVLNKVLEISHFLGLTPTIITFKNHPSTHLRPNHIIPLLSSADQKVQLLKSIGMERIFMLDFDEQLANQSAEEFLTKVMEVSPFRYLIGGYDAKIGRDRQGNNDVIHSLAIKMHFTIEYLPPYLLDDEIISSSLIRKCVMENDFKKAEKLLGRPYSIFGVIQPGLGKGNQIGYPTINIDIASLCHPANGVYAVTVLVDGRKCFGVANLGFAPTVRSDHKLLLEVHLFDVKQNLYGQSAEVIFHELIRPERHFENIEMLKKQISEDVVFAKKLFSSEDYFFLE